MKSMLCGWIPANHSVGDPVKPHIMTGLMSLPRRCARLVIGLLGVGCALAQTPAQIPVDTGAFDASAGANIEVTVQTLRLTWPVSPHESGEMVLNLNPAQNQPLIERIALNGQTILQRVDPVTLLTIGERDLRTPAGWVAFFDNPPLRAYRTVAAQLKKTSASVKSAGSRTVIRIGDVTADSFRGSLEVTVFRHSPLILIEAILSTEQDGRAILYDAGLVASGGASQAAPWADRAATTYSPLVPGPAWKSFAWLDAEGKLQKAPAELNRVAEPLKVSRRTLVAESAGGAIAVFPPPHQYFYPLDFANNLGFAWYGAGRYALLSGYGFGIRQPPEGDRIWVPWVNAPPRTEQRLGVFYLLAPDAAQALEQVGRFTRDDRYKRLSGHRTFTSHYHIEHTLEFVKARLDQNTTGVPRGLEAPGFVKTFKARGVDIVHLGEFHVGSMPRLAARDRLALLKTLHEECARLSDAELLVLPGEEPNVHLGGHWMSFFPKPVYWVLNRAADKPFVEQVEGYGTVYHVGSAADVLELMKRENGLMWTAHARIKGSRGFPDGYWETPFFRSEHFFGAAWKAMPADLSLPRMGSRVLDLVDDMANAGLRKFAIAESDMFRMEPDYESYAHMNINYLQLDRLPRFADGWQPVLDAMRAGKFFATTGEVLIPEFAVRAGEGAGGKEIEAAIEWTFPLAFAEVISGDGAKVHRHRVDLADTEAFGERRLKIAVDLTGRKWVRLEVWDMARNGAFTTTIFLP